MTIKELYTWAEQQNCENTDIFISYCCNDDFYNYTEPLTVNDIDLTNPLWVTINLNSF